MGRGVNDAATLNLSWLLQQRIYGEFPNGTLSEAEEIVVQPGDILALAPGAIHCIENPSTSSAQAIYIYGGKVKDEFDEFDNFGLWEWDTRKKIPFSTDEAVHQSIVRMACSGNHVGIQASAPLMMARHQDAPDAENADPPSTATEDGEPPFSTAAEDVAITAKSE